MSKSTWWLAGGLAAGAVGAGALIRKKRRAFHEQRIRNSDIKVLVVGAGVIGSTYASRLAEWGMDVTLLARGSRLQELATFGLVIQDVPTRRRHISSDIHLASFVPRDADYDFVIIAVRYNQVAEALELVKPLSATTPILVLQSNPEGVVQFDERPPLMGFPAIAGTLVNGIVYSLPFALGTTVIGEPNGADTQRLGLATSILRRAGLRVEVQRQIVPWLETQSAMLAVMAGYIYRNGGRVHEWARRVGEVQIYLDTLREAYQVLEASGIPVTPRAEFSVWQRPARLQSAIILASVWLPWVRWLIDRYMAEHADEMAAAYHHLLGMTIQSGVNAPLLASLREHFAASG